MMSITWPTTALAGIEARRIAAGWAKSAPTVRVVHHASELPVPAPEDVRGAFLRQQNLVYIVADTAFGEVDSTVVHEGVGHAGLRLALGSRWRHFALALRQAAAKGGSVFLRKLRARVRRVYRDENGRFCLRPTGEADEIAAMAAEEIFDRRSGRLLVHDPTLKQLQAVAAHLLRTSCKVNIEVTEAELEGWLLLSEHTLRHGSLFWGAEERARRTCRALALAAAFFSVWCGWLLL